MTRRIVLALVICAAVASMAAAQGKAPRDTGTPNAMQGFSKNKGQPVNIEAERLDVHDKDKTAIFTGKVVVTQGDTTMRCKELKVFYVGQPGKGDAAKPVAKSPDGGEQKIKKLEARGDVVVYQNDQIATGDMAVFDMDTNMVTMTGGSSGGVVLTQGQNVLRGTKLVVDMTTGYSRVEAGNGNNGRVQGLFVPSNNGQNQPGPAKPKQPK
jgi:lipopolysaccharide export system protein LptA